MQELFALVPSPADNSSQILGFGTSLQTQERDFLAWNAIKPQCYAKKTVNAEGCIRLFVNAKMVTALFFRVKK